MCTSTSTSTSTSPEPLGILLQIILPSGCGSPLKQSGARRWRLWVSGRGSAYAAAATCAKRSLEADIQSLLGRGLKGSLSAKSLPFRTQACTGTLREIHPFVPFRFFSRSALWPSSAKNAYCNDCRSQIRTDRWPCAGRGLGAGFCKQDLFESEHASLFLENDFLMLFCGFPLFFPPCRFMFSTLLVLFCTLLISYRGGSTKTASKPL